MAPLTETVEQFITIHYQSAIYCIAIGALICLLLLYWLRWRDYLLPFLLNRRQAETQTAASAGLPKLSVVVPVNDQDDLLEQQLPQWLEQRYPDFEVIVVDEVSSGSTKDLVERFRLRYPALRYTFIPASATDICRRKLAITLGIRAARSEWAVITTVGAVPQSPLWLERLAASMDRECDIVIGYANYADDGTPLAARAILERLKMQLRCFRAALDGNAMGGDEANFCIRKSAFLAHRGYADNLQVSFGESHLLIDSMAQSCQVRLAVAPGAAVREELPVRRVWEGARVYYREILHHASRHSRRYLRREGLASLAGYLLLAFSAAYLAVRILRLCSGEPVSAYSYMADGWMLLLLLTYGLLPATLLRKTTRLLGERNFGLQLPLQELAQPFDNLMLKIRRRQCRKDFTSK